MDQDNISLLAAGVAFYALLAVFPGLAALISIYGLLADPSDVPQQIHLLSGLLPQEATVILDDQMKAITSQPATALSLGVIFSLLIAIWSATRGIFSLMMALNTVYGEHEKRGVIKLYGLAIGLTIGALLMVLLTLALIVVFPAVLGHLGLQQDTETLVSWLRWPLLLVLMMCSLMVIYNIGPSRTRPRWRWVSWGSVIATLLWIVGSALFSYYVANFGSYNETYGSVGAVVVLLMWFYLSAYIVLLGGEFNAEVEHQTDKDSTVGGPKPQGQRGAYVADTTGKSYGE
jgi:membrane protein